MVLPSHASEGATLEGRSLDFAPVGGVGRPVGQFHCAVSPYPFMWNGKPRALVEAPERKWDWSDLQFLRGLCPDDPLEGRAPACWIEDHG